MDALEIEHKCEKCGRIFKDARCLRAHKNKKLPCVKSKMTCEKCGKIFDHKSHYERHVNDRKTPCEAIVGDEAPSVGANENKCLFCGRILTSAKRLENHVKTCKIANNKKVYSDGKYKPGMEALAEKVEKSEKKEDQPITSSEMREFMAELREFKKAMTSPAPQTVNVTNNVNITQNNVLINVRVFDGDQRLDTIDPTEVVKTLNMHLTDIIPTLTEKIHSEVEENRNIYLPNIKENKVLVVKAEGNTKKWAHKDIREVYKILVKRGVDLMYKADDELTEQGKLLTDAEGAKFEMLLNKHHSKTIDDEDIEAIKPVLHKMQLLQPASKKD
jgi:uncharacterized C2H2 Zn-finger protein